MHYQKFKPHERLAPFVECYFTWDSGPAFSTPIEVESPPNGFCSIAINYGDPYFLRNKKYQRLEVPAQFIAGQSLYRYRLFLSGTIGIAGIVFRPAALATLFGLAGFELTEERVDLFQLLNQPYVRGCVETVRCAKDSANRVRLLEEMLLRHVSLYQPQPDYIDTAANRIVDANGQVNVGDLIKDSCMSRRTFERRFFQKVGLSPKYYARIRRIGYACANIAGKKKVNWADIFYEGEYYDQAHFIRDFEEFIGMSPNQYLQHNLELANLVSKPVTQSL